MSDQTPWFDSSPSPKKRFVRFVNVTPEAALHPANRPVIETYMRGAGFSEPDIKKAFDSLKEEGT